MPLCVVPRSDALLVMSRESQAGKEIRAQRNTHNPGSGRSEGKPSFSLNDKAVRNDQEEVIVIPENKVGLVIGKKGWRRNDIKERSGVQTLVIKDCQVRIRGTDEQCTKAKTLIDRILSGEGSPDQVSWKKLDFIPEEYMGHVIGKRREHLDKIEQKTGATLKVWERNSLCIKGSPESQKRAIREIKEQVNILIRRSQAGQQHSARLVHVDTTQLDLNHTFELSVVQPPNDYSAEETKYYQLKQLEQSPQDMEDEQDGFTGVEKLRDKLLEVLTNIHKETEEETLKVVIWCHLGHAYINEVTEDDENEDYFTLAEIKEKLEEKGSWKTSIFKGGLDDIEIERIEKHLETQAVKEDIRYDFTFLTPSCRDVRVKAWLTEKDSSQDEDETASMTFSRNAPIRVKNILTRALPDEQGDSSNTPCFYMCSQYQRKLKVDILMVSKAFDYRLLIRTCRSHVAETPEAEEEDKMLKDYLKGMKIEGDRLVLPPVSTRPDGFDLFYQRRSLIKTYQCEIDGEQFSLIVCKDQANTVDPVETEVRDVHTLTAKTDIHLHCEEWDQMLAEGNEWEPKQIVDKLSSFLQFLREVEINVTGGQ